MKSVRQHSKRTFFLRNQTAFYAVAILAGLFSTVHAATTWNGGSGNWFDGTKWTPTGVPSNGVDVVITNSAASVLLTNFTDNLASLTISNSTLTFSNWDTKLNATNVEIRNGAKFTVPTNFTTAQMSNRVYVVCTNFILRNGGQIETSGRGYRGGGNSYTESGYGPGRGTVVSPWNYGGGGGHGGNGAAGTYGAAGGTYDPTNAPIFPGSGGGGYAGDGGGAVRIDAGSGSVTVEGQINANGTDMRDLGGGGSGGSIYITCGTFGGNTNGLLTAKGGSGYNGGANIGGNGGGGRIAVIYNAAAQSGQTNLTVRFNVSAGTAGGSSATIGTLYLPDSLLFTTNLANFENVRIYGATNCSLDTMTMTNTTVVFAETNFALTVTNALTINTSTLKMGSGITPVAYMQINCGSLTLTNASGLYVYSGPTNAGTTNYGGRVAVANDIMVASNSWIYPASDNTNGGSVYFTANNVTISAGGGFDASGLGYLAGNAISNSGYGPGGGGVSGSGYYGGGGGYGGSGGSGATGSGGSTYPWTNAPRRPGSGGGGYSTGHGGGLVWLDAAGIVVLDGTIKANGVSLSPSGLYGGGGSGGGIFIVADKFRGASSGLLSAYGGIGGYYTSSTYGGAGGGGRIAVWHRVSSSEKQTILANPNSASVNVPRIVIANNFTGTDFLGSCTTSNGYGYGVSFAATGTVVRLTVLPPNGTIFMVR